MSFTIFLGVGRLLNRVFGFQLFAFNNLLLLRAENSALWRLCARRINSRGYRGEAHIVIPFFACQFYKSV